MSQSKPLPMTPAGTFELKSAAFVPGPMPTRDTNTADTERWARGVLRIDLSPAEEWYAIRSTPLTPKGLKA